MINKRLLVKNLLAHNDENSFYDKKRWVYLGDKEGKAKFLKHVCALANSNPSNNAFMVIGVDDEDNKIVGTDFFDDSKIQNLVNAYLENPPRISYENVAFPRLPEDKVVGLVTIRSNGKICSLKKNIWKYSAGSVFFRDGSISMPKIFDLELLDINAERVKNIENSAQNNIQLTLDGVIDFINHRHPDLESHYRVFKEQFVLCWAGVTKQVKSKVYYSRVDIELINEQVRLFYSALDEVEIALTEDSFTTTEYLHLGLGQQKKYYPLEQLTLYFNDNGTYYQEAKMVFEPPLYDKKTLFHIYNSNNTILEKLEKKIKLEKEEVQDLRDLPSSYLICYLNGFEEARQKMETYRWLIKEADAKAYASLKETLRVLRKVKYN